MTTPNPRTTRQRELVRAALARTDGFVTAQALHLGLRADGHTVGLATVYRTLQRLAQTGVADIVRGSDGEAAYRCCSPTHHHHLTCRSCGRTIEVEAPFEAWAEHIGAEHGFRDLSHIVEISGLCSECG